MASLRFHVRSQTTPGQRTTTELVSIEYGEALAWVGLGLLLALCGGLLWYYLRQR